jgi:hypothetical protein
MAQLQRCSVQYCSSGSSSDALAAVIAVGVVVAVVAVVVFQLLQAVAGCAAVCTYTGDEFLETSCTHTHTQLA